MGDPGNPVFFRSKAISGKGLFFPAQVGQILTIPSTNKLFRPPTKGIPAERMFDPPQGGTDTVFWSFMKYLNNDEYNILYWLPALSLINSNLSISGIASTSTSSCSSAGIFPVAKDASWFPLWRSFAPNESWGAWSHWNCYPPDKLLSVPDNLALALAHCSQTGSSFSYLFLLEIIIYSWQSLVIA